ncbi:MAG: hypothetical protein U1D32_01615, partial [Patescibacteria group bacterium]|nr:hypothetical protein [Patescibacteria group bacterium]
ALWSKEAPSELLILRVVASTGHVLIVTADQIWVGGLDSESPDASQQRSSVTDIVIDAAGGIVSAARQTDALLWHDPDPLGLASRQWVVKPTALLSWNRDREVVVGTSRGSVWRQPPDVTVKESFDLFSTPVKALAPGLARDSVVAAASDGRILELSFATEHATLIDQGIGSRSLLCLAYREMERMYVAVSFDETILDPVDMMTATLRTQYRLDMLRQLRGTLVRTYPDRGHPTIVHIDPSHRRLAAVSADGAWLCLAGSTLALFRFEREHLTPAAVRNLTVEHMTFLGTSPAHLVIAVDGSWIEVLELTPELPVLARCKVPSLISSLCTVASRIACGLSDGRIVSLQFHPTVR